MTQTVKIAPPHPQLYVLDSKGGDVPEWEDAPFLSTPSCIMFRCMPSIDGETEVTLGLAERVDPGARPEFDGQLETPSKEIVIETTERDTVLGRAVENILSRVRIWTNHEIWPDRIIIGLN